MNKQEFTSKNTSVNKAKLPAIYNKLNWKFIKETDKAYFVNDCVIDYGCGKYIDHIKSFLKNKGFYFMGYDLYNQPMDKNEAYVQNEDFDIDRSCAVYFNAYSKEIDLHYDCNNTWCYYRIEAIKQTKLV